MKLLAKLVAPWVSLFVAIVGLLLSGAIIGLGGSGGATADGTIDSQPVNADSTKVLELQEQFPEDAVTPAIVVVSRDDRAALSPADLAWAKQTSGQFAQYAVGGQVPPPVPAPDGKVALITVPIPSEGGIKAITEKVDGMREILAEPPAGVQTQVTGGAGFAADISKIFEGADFTLLAVTAGVVALLLLITYRSPWLWLVPLTVVGMADRVAVVAATKASTLTGIPMDESTTGILSVLVFGAGTNYALLLIARYRDELRVTEDKYLAMRTAVVKAGEAIVASASTVILGLACLLLSLIPTTRGLGLAGMVGIVVALIWALMILPSAMVIFGRPLFWPFVPRVGQETLDQKQGIWTKLGTVVSKRPAAVAGAGAGVLLLLATGLFGVKLGLGESEIFLEKPEAVVGGEVLGTSFPAGATSPLEIVSPADQAGAVMKAVAGVEGVASTRPSRSTDTLAETAAILEAQPGSDEAYAAIDRVRAAVSSIPDTYVGGAQAREKDLDEANQRDRWVIMPLILILVLGVLIVLLRAVLGSALLVLTVVGTYAASMGASWWVFRGVFDFPAVGSNVPLLAFLFLVALGVDYNIFLVTRARQEAAKDGTRPGMIRALAATGGVITSAGILLAAVFAVLGVLPLIVLTQIGVIVCIGVLLDTLLVRTIIVPALALMLGDRFWWPSAGPYSGAPVTAGEEEPESVTA